MKEEKRKSHFIHFSDEDSCYQMIINDEFDCFGIETKDNPDFEVDDLVVFVYDHPAEEMLLKNVYRISSVMRAVESLGYKKGSCILDLVKTKHSMLDVLRSKR